jgi:tetratricopeptide (TPR) repeat protein
VRFLKHDYTNAIQDYTHAIELKPDYSNAYQNRSWAKRSAGDAEGAAADMKKAASLEAK